MTDTLQEQEIWGVVDSSKLQNYMECPRKYFFTHVLGWRDAEPSPHLEFGTAWHFAMDQLKELGYTQEGVGAAYDAFMAHWRKYFGLELDDLAAPKTPANAMRGLIMYIQQWRKADEDREILYVERSGAVPIAEDRLIYFKQDLVYRGPDGIVCLDHKSTKASFSTRWTVQWLQKMQMGTYTHMLYCNYPTNEVYGVIVDGFFVAGPPRLRKDGQPYANSRDIEFHRVPIRRSAEQMDEWLQEVNAWYSDLEDDHARLAETHESSDRMDAFRRNTESCTNYGVCPFIDYCRHWPNPLQHQHEIPPGLAVNFWDPRAEDASDE